MTVTINDKEFEMDTVVNMMDNEIREELHNKMAPCNDQDFVDAYCAAHEKKFNETFIIS